MVNVVSFSRVFAGILCLFSNAANALECGDWYVIRSNDSLSKIAADVYGESSFYTRIHGANLKAIGPDPTMLIIGTKIYLPCGYGSLKPQRTTLTNVTRVMKSIAPRKLPTQWDVQIDSAQLLNLTQAQDVQIIDIRSSKAVKKGVIPGAIWMPYKSWRGPKENPGLPPKADQLAKLIGEAGVQLNKPIIIVNSKSDPFDTGRAAYIYWLLKSAGADRLALLQGGLSGWVKANYPLDATPATRPPYNARVTYDRTWWATVEEVEGIADGSQGGTLLDSRPEKMFSKYDKSGAAVATTLPGATNASAVGGFKTLNSDEGGVLWLLSQLKEQNINWQAEKVVSFCNTGELGALNWFLSSEVSGILNVKLYPESAKGWVESGNSLAPADIKN